LIKPLITSLGHSGNTVGEIPVDSVGRGKGTIKRTIYRNSNRRLEGEDTEQSLLLRRKPKRYRQNLRRGFTMLRSVKKRGK